MNNDGLIDGTSISSGARTIDSDFVDNLELGSKFSLLDERLTVNTSVYEIDWDGIPVSQVFGRCTATVNAGKARSRGAELEVSYRLNDSYIVSFSTSYNDAELITDVPSLNALAGDRLPGSARHNASLGIEYRLKLSGHEAYIRGDYSYLGGFYNNLQEEGAEIGDYNKLNINAGISVNKLDVEFYIANVTNDKAFTWIDTTFRDRGNRLRPRTLGLNIGYSF